MGLHVLTHMATYTSPRYIIVTILSMLHTGIPRPWDHRQAPIARRQRAKPVTLVYRRSTLNIWKGLRPSRVHLDLQSPHGLSLSNILLIMKSRSACSIISAASFMLRIPQPVEKDKWYGTVEPWVQRPAVSQQSLPGVFIRHAYSLEHQSGVSLVEALLKRWAWWHSCAHKW